MSQATQDPVVTSSRREAIFAIALWGVALLYTIGYCYRFGYDRSPDDLRFILGIPDWVLWGVLAPWLVCTIVSSLFAKYVMADARIEDEAAEEGSEPTESSRHAPRDEHHAERDAYFKADPHEPLPPAQGGQP